MKNAKRILVIAILIAFLGSLAIAITMVTVDSFKVHKTPISVKSN